MTTTPKAQQKMLCIVTITLLSSMCVTSWSPHTLSRPFARRTGPANVNIAASARGLRYAASDDHDDDEHGALSERMANIRALQKAFYSPAVGEADGLIIDNQTQTQADSQTQAEQSAERPLRSGGTNPRLDETSGILHNVPIWDAIDTTSLDASAINDIIAGGLGAQSSNDASNLASSSSRSADNGKQHSGAWTPIPGRSHVLAIDSAINTHILETMIRTSTDKNAWYIGHIPPSDPRKTDAQDQKASSSSRGQSHDSSLGCLLRIADYRRMMDGRIIVLIHALDRFVVDSVTQTLPYHVADIQLIPDLEELDPYLTQEGLMRETESTMSCARAMAISESMSYYQEYEFDSTHTLPLPCGADNDQWETTAHSNGDGNGSANPANDVSYGNLSNGTPSSLGKASSTADADANVEECYLEDDDLSSKMGRVLPFSPYAKGMQPPTPDQVSSMMIESGSFNECDIFDDLIIDDDDQTASRTPQSSEPHSELSTPNQRRHPRRPLEYQLLKDNILDTPHAIKSSWAATGLSASELEVELWLAINEYLGKTRTPVSPILLGLIPPRVRWPSNFKLNSIGSGLKNLESLLSRKLSRSVERSETVTSRQSIPSFQEDRSPSNSTAIEAPKADDSLSSASEMRPAMKATTTQAAAPSIRRKITHDFVALSRDYPEHRRQKRLSYSAAQLLETAMEDEHEIEMLRQQLLRIPSTKHRMAFVLEQFHILLMTSDVEM